jgi:hypothetical protein
MGMVFFTLQAKQWSISSVHQWQAHDAPHAAGAAAAVAVSPPLLSLEAAAPSMAAGAAVVPEDPPLKSVAYQPEPLS